jgi:serine/threonine protein kinase
MIADFGLTTQGTSKHPIITVNATGTPSYRALKLIRGVDFVYTNTVDLWALGSIFYELLFSRKAFAGDYAVREYSLSSEILEIPVTSAILDDISSWRDAI